MLLDKKWLQSDYTSLEFGSRFSSPDVQTSGTVRLEYTSKGPLVRGIGAVLVFLGLATAWATFVPVASVIMSPAIVEPADNVRSVVHPDGGTIEAVIVKEGDIIRKGNPMFRFDGTALQAELSAVNAAMQQNEAILARDEAERMQHLPKFEANFSVSSQSLIALTQRRLLTAHINARRAREVGYTAELTGVDVATAGLLRQIRALAVGQIAIRDDLRVAQTLFLGGNDSRVHVNQEVRLVSEKQAESEDLASKIQGQRSRRQMIVSAHEQEVAGDQATVEGERNQAEKELFELQRRKITLQAIIARLVVKAPTDGEVSLLAHKFVGESVQPGALLAEVVPLGERTIIIARLDPRYMDGVHVGQAAELKSYEPDAPRHVRVIGRVIRISKTAVAGKDGAGTYYPVAVQLVDDPGNVDLAFRRVGCPLQVAFMQRTASFLGYLLEPMLRAQ